MMAATSKTTTLLFLYYFVQITFTNYVYYNVLCVLRYIRRFIFYPYKCYMHSYYTHAVELSRRGYSVHGFPSFWFTSCSFNLFYHGLLLYMNRCTTLACQLFIFCSGSVVVSIFFVLTNDVTHTHARAHGLPFLSANSCSLLLVFRRQHHSCWSNIVLNNMLRRFKPLCIYSAYFISASKWNRRSTY